MNHITILEHKNIIIFFVYHCKNVIMHNNTHILNAPEISSVKKIRGQIIILKLKTKAR